MSHISRGCTILANRLSDSLPRLFDDGKKTSRPSNFRLPALTFGTILAVLFATLWPFDPSPRNRVNWVPGHSGLQFDRPGIVTANKPIAIGETDSRSVELWLSPANIQEGAVILAFYSPENPRQLEFHQWTDGLLVTHEIGTTHYQPMSTKFDVDHAFKTGQSVLITAVFQRIGTTVYLNGRSPHFFSRFRISPRDVSGQIVLGNSGVDYAPWSGEIRGLAIYNTALTPEGAWGDYQEWERKAAIGTDSKLNGDYPYLVGAVVSYDFREGEGSAVRNQLGSPPDLEIPTVFNVPHKPWLRSVKDDFDPEWRYAGDLAINILGFVPLGILLCRCWRRSRGRKESVVYTILAGAALSLTIEVLQFYVPRRNSGMTDIITNSLGAWLGAWLSQTTAFREILDRLSL
jgi:VanZ family protein